mmetsp:Transcript_45228/g.106729  ORF Transcript_45228/g.106729 Transcript_45228/m.106729 type:complete len:235 (+) Transcript_45228:155-859(+)
MHTTTRDEANARWRYRLISSPPTSSPDLEVSSVLSFSLLSSELSFSMLSTGLSAELGTAVSWALLARPSPSPTPLSACKAAARAVAVWAVCCASTCANAGGVTGSGCGDLGRVGGGAVSSNAQEASPNVKMMSACLSLSASASGVRPSWFFTSREARYLSSCATIAVFPSRTARCSGRSPSMSVGALTSAPASTSNLAHSRCPPPDAMNKGVFPSDVRASGSARASSSRRTTSA